MFPVSSQIVDGVQYDGRIIVDAMTAQEIGEWDRGDEYDPSPNIQPDKLPTYPGRSQKVSKWKDYDMIKPETQESLTPHQRFLLTPFIGGFALDDKSWSESTLHLGRTMFARLK